MLCFDFCHLRKTKELVPCLIGKDCGSTANNSNDLRSVKDQLLELLSHRPSVRDVVAATELLIEGVTALDQLQPHKVSLNDRKGIWRRTRCQYTLKQFHDASASSCPVFSSIRIECLYERFRQRDLNLSCRWM